MRWTWLVLGTIAAAVVGVAGWQAWDAHWEPESMWLDTDRPDCQAWDAQPQRNETATWTGLCRSGKAQGEGVLTWRFNDRTGQELTETYTGTLVDGKQDGRATTIRPNSFRYDGEYRDGERNGHGVLLWDDGDSYDGAWKNGRPHGAGVFTTDGTRYDGEWTEGCLDYQGTAISLRSDDECERILQKPE